MNNEIYECYKRAGTIAADTLHYGATLLKPGVKYEEVASAVESRIKAKGGGLAFPVNIANNFLAAHYSPRLNDPLTFKKGDLVKLDVGAHINGYIADTALTIEIGTTTYTSLIQASSEALDNAIHAMKADVNLSEIGRIIEQTITSHGFQPIENLMGHGLRQYELHSGLSVPNVGRIYSKTKPQEGDVIAIEPFATNGAGHVVSGEGSNIYLCSNSLKTKLIRDARSKQLYQKINTTFKTLPFAQRWCHELMAEGCDVGLRKLSLLGITKQYPQLLEVKKGMVTQKEHTVIVHEDGCEVIT